MYENIYLAIGVLILSFGLIFALIFAYHGDTLRMNWNTFWCIVVAMLGFVSIGIGLMKSVK